MLLRVMLLCLSSLLLMLTLKAQTFANRVSAERFPLAQSAYGLSATDTIYVKASATGLNDGSSWTNAFTSLQSALAAATSGEMVWVAAGTYKPSGTARTSTFSIPAGVEMYGGFTGTETAISQRPLPLAVSRLSGNINSQGASTDNCYHVVTIGSGTSATLLDGFEVTEGLANGGGTSDAGGGIYFAPTLFGTNPIVRNCLITLNQANFGAGAYAGNSSSTIINYPIIESCIFSNNIAITSGGGMYSDGFSKPQFSHCTFHNNSASYGGGLFDSGSGIVGSTLFTSLDSCVITDNDASGTGGGIHIMTASFFSNNLQITDCEIGNNTADVGGGGIYISTTNGTCNPSITGCLIHDNHSEYGGGIYTNLTGVSVSPAITRCIFTGNTAISGGAGFLDGTAASSTIKDCIFYQNISDDGSAATWGTGGGVQRDGTGTTTLINCVLTQNRAGGDADDGGGGIAIYGGTMQLTNCTLYDNFTESQLKPLAHEISVLTGATLTLKNTIVSNSITFSQPIVNAGTFSATYSMVSGGTIPPGIGNMSGPTGFLNPGNPSGADNSWLTADDGLRLGPCSNALNKGSNSGVAVFDIAGANRVQHGKADLGAYESSYAFNPLQASVTTTSINCYGNTSVVTLTATGGSGSYTYRPDSLASPQSSNTFTLPAGTYTLYVSDANGCERALTTTITQPQALALTYSGGKICNSGITDVTLQGSGGTSPYQYQLGSGIFQTGNTFSGLTAGTYTFTLKDSKNCLTDTLVTLIQLPLVFAQATGDTTICAGQATTLSGAGSGGTSPYTYSWNNGAGVGPIRQVSPAITTTYQLTVVDNMGCSAQDSATVTIAPAPVIPPISRVGDTLSVPAGLGTYQWLFSGIPLSGTQSNTLIIGQIGSYSVCVTNIVGCKTCTAPIEITHVAVDVPAAGWIRVYPNPFSSELQVESSHPEATRLSLTNIFGQTVFEGVPEASSRLLPTDNLPSGIYLLSLWKDERQLATIRVVRQ